MRQMTSLILIIDFFKNFHTTFSLYLLYQRFLQAHVKKKKEYNKIDAVEFF